MRQEIKQLSEQARVLYWDIVKGTNSRVDRGHVLWAQFESAVDACSTCTNATVRALTERINELAVAKALIEDPNIFGPISYEPALLPNGQRIDFVAFEEDRNIYVEVKTVHPQAQDTKQSWDNYLRRRTHHPKNVIFHVERNRMGGAIYGDSFAARSHFLDYTLDFESRLAAAKVIRDGLGILVFCGNGFSWSASELEDFADFYRTGIHRPDDPFAPMEQHHIDKEGLQLLRNVDLFACLKRAVERAELEQLTCPVRGPSFGGPHSPA